MFSKALLESEKPRGLSKLEQDQYKVLLEDQAFPFEDNAIKFYEKNVLHTKQGIFDDWVRNSYTHSSCYFRRDTTVTRCWSPISMSCTKGIFVLFVALAGCAVSPDRGTSDSAQLTDHAAAEVADKEIALFQQAITSLNNAELDNAEADFKELTRSRPGLAGPWINLALIDIKKNNIGGAEKNVAQALDRNPKMPQVYNLLGVLEVSKGNMVKAVEHYRQAISLKADYAVAHYNIALLHDTYLHDNATAVQHYKRYLELTNHADKKTAEWVAELERSLSRGAQ